MYNCGLSAFSRGLIPSLRLVDLWGEALRFVEKNIKCCLDLSLPFSPNPLHIHVLRHNKHFNIDFTPKLSSQQHVKYGSDLIRT